LILEMAPLKKCWEWNGKRRTEFGYGVIGTKHNGADIQWFVHRVSYVAHIGPILDRICVLHKCDNPRCVNPFHLFLGTRKDNTQDMVEKGR